MLANSADDDLEELADWMMDTAPTFLIVGGWAGFIGSLGYYALGISQFEHLLFAGVGMLGLFVFWVFTAAMALVS